MQETKPSTRSAVRMHRHLLSDSLTMEANNNYVEPLHNGIDSKVLEETGDTQGDELRRLKTSRGRLTRSATTGLLL